MKSEIKTFNSAKEAPYDVICDKLAHIIDMNLKYGMHIRFGLLMVTLLLGMEN